MEHKLFKSRWSKVLLVLSLILIIGGTSLYYLIQSPRFIRFAIEQVNRRISGDLSYSYWKLDFERRNLSIRDLIYFNQNKERVFSIDQLDLNFSFGSVWKGAVAIDRLWIGRVDIDQRKSEKKLTPSSWRSILRGVLKRVFIENSLIREFNVALLNGDTFHFENIQLILTPQHRQKQQVKVWIQNSRMEPADLKIQTGALFFQGELKIPLFEDFTFFVSEAEGGLALSDVQIGKLPPSSFRSQFKIGGEVLYLINGWLIHPEGSLRVDVDYIPKKSTYKVDLKTARPFPFRAIPSISQRLIKTFDTFDLSLRAELSGFKLETMDGKVNLDLKTLGNHANPLTPENKLHLEGKMKKGELNLDEFEITSAKTKIKASGKVDFSKQRFDVKINTTEFDLITLLSTLTELDLRGYADAEGTIQGPFKSPEFSVKAHGKEVAYSFLHFGESAGLFEIKDGNLSYEGGAPSGVGYTANVRVKTENIYHRNKHTVLKTDFQNLQATNLLDNPEITGKVGGIFELEDFAEKSPTGNLKAKIDDFLVYGFNLGPVEAEGKLGDKKFIISPLTFQPPKIDKMQVPQEVVFSFDEKGVQVKGEVLPGLSMDGHYTYAGPKKFFVDATAQNLDLRPIWAALLLPPIESYTDGKIKLALGIQGAPSEIDLEMSRFVIPLEGNEVTLAEPLRISIRPPKMIFQKARFLSAGNVFSVDGSYTFDGPMDLRLTGRANLGILSYFREIFREAEGFADLDLRVTGTKQKPQALGEINFSDASLTLRLVRGRIENLHGKIKHTGQALLFENLTGTMAEGDITLNGRVDLDQLKPKYFDLEIKAREVAISEPAVYKLILSGDLLFKGGADSPVLSGDIFITEGRYSRDFQITQFIVKPKAKLLPEEPNPWLSKIQLALGIKSSGDLAIKNNVAEIFMIADLKLSGPAESPKVLGELQVVDGEVHYFKINFESARGFVDFRSPKEEPYVDITASKEFLESFGTVTVGVNVQGFLNNLQINFSSDAGLNKREILSLVFTGALPGEGRSLSGGEIAGAVVASQLSGILSRHASLDVFRLESTDPENLRGNNTGTLSRLVVGKRLTERFTIEFKTDLGSDDPAQGVQMEYLLLDNVLIKASQLSDGSFDLNQTLRWRWF